MCNIVEARLSYFRRISKFQGIPPLTHSSSILLWLAALGWFTFQIIGKLKSGFQLQTKAAQEAHGSQFESLNAEKEEFRSSIRKLTFEKETLADMKDMALTKVAAVQHELDLAIKAHGTFPARLQESLQLAELMRSEAKASDDEIARLKTELGQAKADHASSIRSLSSQLRNVESVAEQAAESMFDKAPPYVASLCGCQHRLVICNTLLPHTHTHLQWHAHAHAHAHARTCSSILFQFLIFSVYINSM